MAFGIYSLYHLLQPRFREQRRRLFRQYVEETRAASVLDVGGNPYDWDGAELPAKITVLNVEPLADPSAAREGITFVQGDGCRLPFPAGSFDIVYSNSVIEHLRTRENQQSFAEEAQRVGRHVFVQTPNRWFPIEPHFVAPFFHFLPKALQRIFLPHCSVRALLRSGDNADLQTLFEETRLLSAAELRQLFPRCELVRERLLGLTKSLIAQTPVR